MIEEIDMEITNLEMDEISQGVVEETLETEEEIEAKIIKMKKEIPEKFILPT